MAIDLAPGTTYWFALRSVDDVGNPSVLDDNAVSPALQASALTGTSTDTKTPAPVAGFVVTQTALGYTITWPSVAQNDDGTPITDLASYRVYSSPSLFDFAASSTVFTTVPMAGPLSIDIPTPATDTYYLVTAVHNSGRMSAMGRSNFLHVTSARFLGQTGTAQNGTYSRAFVPEGLIPELKTSDKNFPHVGTEHNRPGQRGETDPSHLHIGPARAERHPRPAELDALPVRK